LRVSARNTVQILLHSTIAHEIGINEFRRFFCSIPKLLREPEWRQAVNNAEVDGFGGAAVLCILRHRPYAEHFLRGPRVDILPLRKASTSTGSFEKCAMMRSSICE